MALQPLFYKGLEVIECLLTIDSAQLANYVSDRIEIRRSTTD